jgi:hypothetical protein
MKYPPPQQVIPSPICCSIDGEIGLFQTEHTSRDRILLRLGDASGIVVRLEDVSAGVFEASESQDAAA